MFDKKIHPHQNPHLFQISDTVKNSYIHVFPDKQDLVNPVVISDFKIHSEINQQYCFAENYEEIEHNNLEIRSLQVEKNGKKIEKNKIITKMLPNSIFEDSSQGEKDLSANSNKNIDLKFDPPKKIMKSSPNSSENQSYLKLPSKDFCFPTGEAQNGFEDFSEITKLENKEIISFDESDDMSFDQVIKTLEKNIARSKAIRKHIKDNNQKMYEVKTGKNSFKKNQDDTLSLEKSFGSSNISRTKNSLYNEKPKDLRLQFLSTPIEGNNTVYYSFVTDNQESVNWISEKNLKNTTKMFSGALEKQLTPAFYLTENGLIKNKGHGIQRCQTSNNQATVFTKSPYKIESTKIEEKMPSLKTPMKQKIAHIITSNQIKPSNHDEQIVGAPLLPKTQPSDNYILCINCNELLPSISVDSHSIYCNENMLAQEELSKALIIDPGDLLLSLEKCNLRLKELKVLLEKNLKNLKGQIQLQLIRVQEVELLFSDMNLLLQILEEIIRTKKTSYKLQIDMKSVSNLKGGLSLFIDVTLINIIIFNLEVVLNICQQKKFVLELIQRQENFLQTSTQLKETNDIFINNPMKNVCVSKYELEKLQFGSLASPQNVSINPISHSHKSSLPTSASQSTRGSSINSRRMPLNNRIFLGSETKN